MATVLSRFTTAELAAEVARRTAEPLPALLAPSARSMQRKQTRQIRAG